MRRGCSEGQDLIRVQLLPLQYCRTIRYTTFLLMPEHFANCHSRYHMDLCQGSAGLMCQGSAGLECYYQMCQGSAGLEYYLTIVPGVSWSWMLVVLYRLYYLVPLVRWSWESARVQLVLKNTDYADRALPFMPAGLDWITDLARYQHWEKLFEIEIVAYKILIQSAGSRKHSAGIWHFKIDGAEP